VQVVLVQVITGTTREGRFSERVAAWVTGRLAQHDAFEVELVDLRDHPLSFFDGEPPARGPGVTTPTRRWSASAASSTGPTAT